MNNTLYKINYADGLPAEMQAEDGALCEKLTAFIAGLPVVVVCVGTDIVGGDCLGPLVGQLLREGGAPAYVYGTLSLPVNALNVNETGAFVRERHKNSVVIAVDSAVGKAADAGRIAITKSALCPGLAGGKTLERIGDISITAVTSSSLPGDKEFSLVRLGFVYCLAKRISGIILQSLRHCPCV